MKKTLSSLMRSYGIDGIGKSIHLAISQSFVALLFILVDFIFSKTLSVAEFGAWKELFFIFNLGIPLLAFGLPEGYKYFIAKTGSIDRYFLGLRSVLLCISLLVLLGLILVNGMHLADWIDFGPYYLNSLLFPIPALAFLLNKSLRYTYINLDQAERLTKLAAIGSVLAVIAILVGWWMFEQGMVPLFQLAIGIYTIIFLLPATLYWFGAGIKVPFFKFEQAVIGRMVRYGFPLYLASFAGLLTVYLDKLIVSLMEDSATFAIFAVGAFEIPIFAMLSAAFSQQIFPRMVRFVEENEETKAQQLWVQTTLKVSLITYPMILLLMIFAEPLIYFIYSPEYEASIWLFKTYLLVALFRNNSYGILLTSKGETKIITKISLVVLGLNITTSIALYYFYGIIGIVFGTLVSVVFASTYFLYREQLLHRVLKHVWLNPIIALFMILIILFYFL